ncbi:hypothetical protein V8B97DRAFT_2012433 [Scleroderma yunnanense]
MVNGKGKVAEAIGLMSPGEKNDDEWTPPLPIQEELPFLLTLPLTPALMKIKDIEFSPPLSNTVTKKPCCAPKALHWLDFSVLAQDEYSSQHYILPLPRSAVEWGRHFLIGEITSVFQVLQLCERPLPNLYITVNKEVNPPPSKPAHFLRKGPYPTYIFPSTKISIFHLQIDSFQGARLPNPQPTINKEVT